MNLKNKIIVITGAANGIGEAMSQQFAANECQVIVADIDIDAAKKVAQSINGTAMQCDVTDEQQVIQLINTTESQLGPIDIFCSNAGLARGEGDHVASASNTVWELNLVIHLMSHVYAARALLPRMIKRGNGYFVQVSSAAGLLCQMGDAAYSASKHAAVSFAESLAITHGDQGIKVSLVCPQYVATQLTGYQKQEKISVEKDVISVDNAAKSIVQGVKDEKFLILTHPVVEKHCQYRSADHDNWIDSMRTYRRTMLDQDGKLDFEKFVK